MVAIWDKLDVGIHHDKTFTFRQPSECPEGWYTEDMEEKYKGSVGAGIHLTSRRPPRADEPEPSSTPPPPPHHHTSPHHQATSHSLSQSHSPASTPPPLYKVLSEFLHFFLMLSLRVCLCVGLMDCYLFQKVSEIHWRGH